MTKIKTIIAGIALSFQAFSAPEFIAATPLAAKHYKVNGPALCATAKETLAYLAKGQNYDPLVIHQGKIVPIPLSQLKDTLVFICHHQNQMNNPDFVKAHFNFLRWYPDQQQARLFSRKKPLLEHLPKDRILMTKYYVHLAKASASTSPSTPYALYALPKDEKNLSFEEAEAKPELTRFHYGKQAILTGALTNKGVPVLAYLSRDDLEAALLQGTIVADFGDHKAAKIFNVHRCNNIAYNKMQAPYQQNRYWYFKQVDGIKGYGKDAEHKITVNPEVTFAADLQQFGLGKLLMVQYPDKGEIITRVGILADTGGAFSNNLYQVDFLAGSYPGKEAFYKATRHIPDYVNAYFMVLKEDHKP